MQGLAPTSFAPHSRMPVLPHVYALPWETRGAMFPQTARGRLGPPPSARGDGSNTPLTLPMDPSLKPRVLKSSFGEQASSHHESPASVVLFGGPSRFAEFGKFSYRGPPGPQFPAPSTFGLQPRSTYNTASRPVTSKEGRWATMERFQRATATPGPGTYNPAV